MKESDVQKAILKMLKSHPKVGWAYITSSGYVKGLGGGKMFRVGVPGMSDIMGQMKDGRLLAIEVKVPGKRPTESQMQFIADVNRFYGIAGWADSVETAMKITDEQ
jgi:hypothetical protein